ncbi:hypothetical protein C8R44DRAFT_988575 [Mycena epipterygia]|nr:hypothetical protein C8R44DRAFT_988575 [Mycena epipterygia]
MLRRPNIPTADTCPVGGDDADDDRTSAHHHCHSKSEGPQREDQEVQRLTFCTPRVESWLILSLSFIPPGVLFSMLAYAPRPPAPRYRSLSPRPQGTDADKALHVLDAHHADKASLVESLLPTTLSPSRRSSPAGG